MMTAPVESENDNRWNKMCDEIKNAIKKGIMNAIEDSEIHISISNLNEAFNILNKTALEKLNAMRLDDKLSNVLRTKLSDDLLHFQNVIDDKIFLFNLHVFTYFLSMERIIDKEEKYLTREQLLSHHDHNKSLVVDEFMKRLSSVDDGLTSSLQLRMKSDIDNIFLRFDERNSKKREDYFRKSNENIIIDITREFDVFMESKFSNSYVCSNRRRTLYEQADQRARDEFNEKKIATDEIFNAYRNTFEETLRNLHTKWDEINSSRKMKYIAKESSKASVVSIVGAIAGGISGGLRGAIAGALLAGASSYALWWASSR